MPSQLKHDALCPACGLPLEFAVWTRHQQTVDAEFVHSKLNPKHRRVPRCRMSLSVTEEAKIREELHL